MSIDTKVDSDFVTISELTSSNSSLKRIKELRSFYCNKFNSEPEFFIRVPGRVNIIGEHVDYCGFPVLPMAIDQSILLAVGHTTEDTMLHLHNTDVEKYVPFKCDLRELCIELPKSGGPEWYKYFLCGIKGVFETLNRNFSPIGMTVAISGNIPPASGLSSPSALVSAATLATAHVHRLPLDRKHLATISASCERYIGTQGGGMDQAIVYLAKGGSAQFIEFYPELCTQPIPLPDDICFVVANSLSEANKAASSSFNERVVECRLGCLVMAKKLKLGDWLSQTRLAQLQHRLHCTLFELEEHALKLLPKEQYSRLEICKEFDLGEVEFGEQFLTENTRHMSVFKLRQRTLHVLQESLRVLNFRSICERGIGHLPCDKYNNPRRTKDSPLEVLSQLLRQSHESLKHLFECSHPSLDRLVDISQACGVGARLTGAGWGGCIVALCTSAEAPRYIQSLKDQYFSRLPPKLVQRHQLNDFQEVVFATYPCGGAEILTTPASGTEVNSFDLHLQSSNAVK